MGSILLKTETIFLTGITGTLGGWIAREALEEGHRLIALVRDSGDSTSEDRVAASLDLAGAGQWQDRVEIFYGDLCQKNFGADQIEQVFSRCDRIIHSAAMTSFQPNMAEENRRTNIDGTQSILDVAEAFSIPLVYISTSYVAGQRHGMTMEAELDQGQTFNNSYEQTKCQAETLVRRWSEKTQLETIILRPSIVLGDSKNGRISRFNTIYDMMRIFEVLKSYNNDQTIRVVGSPTATKNLIPIDYFARVAWHLIARQKSGTYHITNPNPVSIKAMQDHFAQLFGIHEIRLVDSETLEGERLTKSERLINSACSVYEPYLLDEPLFDRTETDLALQETDIEFPEMDLAYFQRLLDYALSTDWGRQPQPISSSAPPAPPAISNYFSDFFAKNLNQTLASELKSLDASFKIAIKETPDWHWSFTVEQGELTRLSRNGQPTQCDFLVETAIFSDIVSAKMTPQQAFASQQIQIEGDMVIGLKVAAMLTEFFRQCPCDVTLDSNDSETLQDQSA